MDMSLAKMDSHASTWMNVWKIMETAPIFVLILLDQKCVLVRQVIH
jgi:hypothetical protein